MSSKWVPPWIMPELAVKVAVNTLLLPTLLRSDSVVPVGTVTSAALKLSPGSSLKVNVKVADGLATVKAMRSDVIVSVGGAVSTEMVRLAAVLLLLPALSWNRSAATLTLALPV